MSSNAPETDRQPPKTVDAPRPEPVPSHVDENGAAPATPVFPIVAGLVLLVGAAVLSYVLLGQGGASPTGGRPPGSATTGRALVSVAPVATKAFVVVRRVSGEIGASRQARLKSRVSGQVASVLAVLGQEVRKGQLLVTLDASTLPAELERAKANADAAKARLNRATVILADATAEAERRERLVAKGASAGRTRRESRTARSLAESGLELANADVRLAAADVEVLRVRLEQTRTRAPFAGKIVDLQTVVGDGVNAGDLIASIAAAGPPRVSFGLTEAAARGLSIGDEVEVFADGEQAAAVVDRVSAGLNATDRSRTVEAVFAPELEGKILPGGFAEVEIRSEAPEGSLIVSLGGLRGRGMKRTALVIVSDAEAGDIVKKTTVEVLLEDGREGAILGLKVGDRVVVAGGAKLKDGAKVEVLK